MVSWLLAVPGRIFVLATLLPLVVALLMAGVGTIRSAVKPYRFKSKACAYLYGYLGGDTPLRAGAYLATATIFVSAVLSILGLIHFFDSSGQAETTSPWAESVTWIQLSLPEGQGLTLELGYRMDELSVLLFAMVCVISSMIFLFSLGYMQDETEKLHTDHEIHYTRSGRYGRFFLFLLVFCFSMLNLLIADNLFQIFVSWELVGLCSFLLISFYHERPKAGLAANKAFIMNRVGDAGFLIGLAILWTTFGTLNCEELRQKLPLGGLAEPLLTLAGLGIFLGCVGKSAQFPLHTWLPDAMEGPTPVSALIHAATMVAAGVYLVGRVYWLFTTNALFVIAATGMITLLLAATIAVVMTDIKRILAYSTVSQLGYMMLALGVGAWTAGLFHLITHAFFKALLFLCSGSVIHGCHHEQDIRQMGGLRKKMPLTAYTMLIGVLAISGLPFLSGWYSKDQILAAAMGFGLSSGHIFLFVVPLFGAGLTAFYMMRLWLLTFTGEARSEVAAQAHESPRTMTLPLIVLAVFSVGIGWGWPLWNPEASLLSHTLERIEPSNAKEMVQIDHLAGWLGLGVALFGVLFSCLIYLWRKISAETLKNHAAFLHSLLSKKWYFDEIYSALFVRTTQLTGAITGRFDKHPTSEAEDNQVNLTSLDGTLNALGQGTIVLSERLRPFQSGILRNYVTILMLTITGLVGIIYLLSSLPSQNQ